MYWRVVGLPTWVAPERREWNTGTDGVVPSTRFGRVRLGDLGALDALWRESYGGGRYALDTTRGADLGGDAGALVVDLSFAYQPSCAHDEA